MDGQIYGIQGGKGSFNEEAINYYLRKKSISDYKIKYLYTTEKVLQNIEDKNINFGLFAIQNSVGGLVDESVTAMAKHQFRIVEEFQIPITHHLMTRKEIPFERIDTIMAHPQVLKQCKSTLSEKYKNLNKLSGKGDLLDTAKAAEALYKGQIPSTTAILGPQGLSKLYDLKIIENNLQDDKTNNTTFLLVTQFV